MCNNELAEILARKSDTSLVEYAKRYRGLEGGPLVRELVSRLIKTQVALYEAELIDDSTE